VTSSSTEPPPAVRVGSFAQSHCRSAVEGLQRRAVTKERMHSATRGHRLTAGHAGVAAHVGSSLATACDVLGMGLPPTTAGELCLTRMSGGSG
jgi:hypothetical protein